MIRMLHTCVETSIACSLLYQVIACAVVQYHLTITILYHREPVMVFEGQEKENFWNVLGGKKEYVNDKRLQVSARMLVMGRIEPTESIKL